MGCDTNSYRKARKINIYFSQFLCGHGHGRKVSVEMRCQHPSVWHKVYHHFSQEPEVDSLILSPSVEIRTYLLCPDENRDSKP